MQDPTQSSVPDVSVSSFIIRATNVFSSPGELFSEVAVSPVQTTSWLLPYIFSVMMAFLFTFSIFNNPVLLQQAQDIQLQEMKRAVQQGRISQEQFDRTSEAIESTGPVLFIVMGGGGAVVAATAVYFGIALLLWLVTKFGMKFSGSYKKTLEVYGLTSFIGILGSIITLLMVNLFDTMFAVPAASLAILDSFDPSESTHRLLSSLNIFTLWQTALVGYGIARVSNKPAHIGISTTLGLFAIWAIIAAMFHLGM